jgi:hypothetical protein
MTLNPAKNRQKIKIKGYALSSFSFEILKK